VPVYDLGRDPVDHDPFYVMKLVQGRTLYKAIRDHHKFTAPDRPDPSERRRLLGALVQVGHAVAYAHARGVLHLDLKPSNVVLGDFGEVVVLDWGLARLQRGVVEGDGPVDGDAPTLEAIFLSAEARVPGTTAGRVQGTKEYMAPEQAGEATDRIDERADVFGLGAILFEVLTGQPPRQFGDEPLDRTLDRIRTEPSRRPRAVLDYVPSALDDFCGRAMAADPALRIRGAAAFVAELETWLADEPLVDYRAIVAGFDAMVAKHPEVIDYREQLARNRANLGLVLDGLGRHFDAETTYRAAIADYEALVAAQPLLPGPRAGLAATRTHLGRTLRVLGRYDEADATRDAALADYTALAAAHPPARDYTTGLASVYLTLTFPPSPAGPTSPPRTGEPTSMVTETVEPITPPMGLPSPGEGEKEMTETGSLPTEFPGLENRGRLRIQRQLGMGGQSEVYLARDDDLNRDVAVKILRDIGDNASMRWRFLREAQITAQLEHPNIVPIYGLGYRSHDNTPFLIMRLVSGSTLTQAIRDYHARRGPHGRHTAELGRLLRWLAEVCGALAFAHAAGIIHRDPKPSNVLIGPSGAALLVDWGLATVVNQPDATTRAISVAERATPTDNWGSIVGTPAYMAPEQARGTEELIGAKTDIYVVGAGLFEILTGRLPFQPQDSGGVQYMLEAILAGPAPSARVLDPSVPAALDAICARAMARDPKDRYATALDLKNDLEGWLYGGPIAVYPESRIRRTWRRLHHGWATPSD